MKALLIGTVLLTGRMLMAQSPVQDKSDGQELIDNFFTYYKQRGPEIALKYAFSTNKWINNASGDETLNISMRLIKLVSTMGDYIGYEEIRSSRVGSRLRFVTFFVYYERDPLRFIIELYKTNSGWEITHVDFDTKFEEEIEESMKFNGR